MLKTGQRARSSAGRDLAHWLSFEISRMRPGFNTKWTKASTLGEEILRLQDLGPNTPTAGQDRDAISIDEPQGTYTDVEIYEIKKMLELQHEIDRGSGVGVAGVEMMSLRVYNLVNFSRKKSKKSLLCRLLRSNYCLVAGDMSPGKVAHVIGDTMYIFDSVNYGNTLSSEMSPEILMRKIN
uniref:Uncharacterized protein n=1 Tax=Tanacetum cinerariifolium TaxID=118510 RepID=A0A699H869_TANCI|nr:hypothetical protein [Tanacetum cinerariifolium]